jgi:hypothetical protein
MPRTVKCYCNSLKKVDAISPGAGDPPWANVGLHWGGTRGALLLGSRVGSRLSITLLLGLAVGGPLLLRIWVRLLLSVRVGLSIGGALLSRVRSVHRLTIGDTRSHSDHHGLGKVRDDHSAAAAVAAHGADEYPEEDPSADANPQSPSSDTPDGAGAAGVVPVGAGGVAIGGAAGCTGLAASGGGVPTA